MNLVPGDKEKGLKTPVWDEYKTIINKAEGKQVLTCIIIDYKGMFSPPPQIEVELIERFAFYDRAKTAFAVVATGYKL